MKAVACPRLPTIDLQALVASAELPSMPAAMARLLQLGGSRDATVEQIAEIVATDPKLSARILGLANSAENYRGQVINTIPKRAQRLGSIKQPSFSLLSDPHEHSKKKNGATHESPEPDPEPSAT